MSTFLKTAVALGLMMVLVGTAHAVVLNPSNTIPPGSPRGDVGVTDDPAVAGSVSTSIFLPGIMKVTGGGSGTDGSDHGFFLYEPLVGDGTITALVKKFDTVGGYVGVNRMAGLMIRDSIGDPLDPFLDPYAVNVANLVLPVDGALKNHAQSQVREEIGGATTVYDQSSGIAGQPPGVGSYLKITKAGNDFSFAWSDDNFTFHDFPYSPATIDVEMFGTVYVGLFVTAGNADEAAQAQFAQVSITGFATPEWIYWDELGSDDWGSASWEDAGGIPVATTPSPTTHVVLRDTNTDRITVANDGRALSLTVGPDDGFPGFSIIEVLAGKKLTVDEETNFGAGTRLEMGPGTSLRAMGGGSIAEITGITGDVTIENVLDLEVDRLGAHLFASGKLTKDGGGTLQLDNSSGGVNAEFTTFVVEGGVLASVGGDPLGGADGVTLDGGDLSLVNAGPINMLGAPIEVKQDATINTESTGATLGPLTLDQVMLATAGSGGMGFDGTTIRGEFTTQVTIDTGIDTTAGGILVDALNVGNLEIIKDGPEKLIVNQAGSNLGNTTFRVDDGTLVGVHGSFNPLGDADINLDTGNGGLLLSNPGGGPVEFGNFIEVNSESTLSADGPNIKLTGDIELWDDLHVETTDPAFVLEIAGELKGDDGFRMVAGSALLSGGGGGNDLEVRGGTLTTSAPNDFSRRVFGKGGTLIVGAQMDVGNDVRWEDSASVLETSATLNVGDDLEVKRGVVTTGALLFVDDDMKVNNNAQMTANAQVIVDDDLEVWDDGQLALNAAAEASQVEFSDNAQVSAVGLVVDDYLYQDASGQPRVTYSIDTGTFTASGSDMLNAINLEFGGNKLTVTGPGPSTVADSSGNGYDGDVHGGSLTGDVAAAVAGGKSMDFNGGDNYVIVDTGGTQDVFDLGANITVAFWQKEWPDGSWEPMVSKRGESGKGWQVRRRGGSSDNMAFTLRGTSDEDAEAKDAWVKDDGWHHVVATYDGATRDIYIDGGLWDSDAVTGGVNATGAALVFGARNNSESNLGDIGNYSHVLLDEIHIYDRAITQAEVDALVANSGISTAGLVGKWTFEDLGPHLDVPDTNLKVTDNATLEVAHVSSAFGDLELVGGADLTVSGSQDGISFGSLSGSGSVSGVLDVTVGDASPGSSPVGVLDVFGNLTLGDGYTYDWDWDGTNGDLINVKEISPGVGGDLAAVGDWALNIRPPAGEDMSRGKYPIFTYEGAFKLPLLPDFLINGSQASPLWESYLSLEVDTNGNVLLDVVPEPSTLVLLLTAGVLGLIGLGRRRRRA